MVTGVVLQLVMDANPDISVKAFKQSMLRHGAIYAGLPVDILSDLP